MSQLFILLLRNAMLRLPELSFELDSTANKAAEDNSRAHLKFSLQKDIVLSEGPHWLALTASKIPLTVYNITAAKGNNYISYTVDDGVTWYDIDFADGVYGLADIDSAIRYELTKRVHYLTVGDVVHFPFNFAGNGATSKAYFTIDTACHITVGETTYNSTDVRVDLKGCELVEAVEVRGTSTFYTAIGFEAANTLLDGSVATEFIGTKNVDIYDGQYSIECNLISRLHRGQNSRKLITDTFNGTANGYYFLPNASIRDVVAEVDPSFRKISEVDVKIVDRNGRLVVFGDDSTDGDIYMNFQIF